MPAPRLYWLELLLRQHELCWRPPQRADEQRIVLLGSSGVFGFPLAVEETFGALLNADFLRRDLQAHLFNLAWVGTYQLRDAAILHEALPYRPDLILYPVTLNDFFHRAPMLDRGSVSFFDRNSETVTRLVENPPRGLEEPFEKRYRPYLENRSDRQHPYHRFREVGLFVRDTARRHAESLAERYASFTAPSTVTVRGRRSSYDCEETQQRFERNMQGWQEWNILAHLEDLQQSEGIDVLIVNWPIAYEPMASCYNVRYPKAAVREFNQWLENEALTRGFGYVELHDLLPATDFLDSLHVNAAGHRQIADVLGDALYPIVQRRVAQQRPERYDVKSQPGARRGVNAANRRLADGDAGR